MKSLVTFLIILFGLNYFVWIESEVLNEKKD